MSDLKQRELTRRKNYLLRVLNVQKLYQKNKVEGVPDAHVFREYIGPAFNISLRTFREYMGVNAKKELREMQVEVSE